MTGCEEDAHIKWGISVFNKRFDLHDALERAQNHPFD